MKTYLQKLLKTSGLLLLLLAVIPSCKKETTIKPIPPTPEVKTSSIKGKIDGKDFAIKESGITSTLYSTSGDGVKSLETAATLDADGSKLTFFIDDLKNGAIALSKKSGTSLNPGTRTIRINSTTPVQSYVYYYSSGNEYYAFSGSIEITVTDTDITIKWNIMFKDASGREFNSSGSFSITYASVVTKSKSEVKDPTPVADKPTIESITPNRGRAGDVVAIAGVNYSTTIADNIVKFNGVNAVVTSATATKLTVKAPTEGTTGAVTVKVKNSEVATGPVYSYIGAATFTSFAPASAKAGDIITITGTNFSETLADNIVHFSGAQNTVFTGTVTAATETQLKVTVPQGAVTGKIYLTVNSGLKLTSATDFTLTVPSQTNGWTQLELTVSPQAGIISASSGSKMFFSNGKTGKYLYYSSDKGVTFTNVFNSLPLTKDTLKVNYIVADGNYFYITTNLGVIKTDGTSFTKLTVSPNQPNLGFNGIVAKNDKIYLLLGTSNYVSLNGGATFQSYPMTLGGATRLDYITSDGNGKYFYAIDPTTNKFYKSTNQGQNWSATTGTTGNYFLGEGYKNILLSPTYTYAIFSTGTQLTGNRLYQSRGQGDVFVSVIDEQVNVVKQWGDYVAYGGESFSMSNDVGATYKHYTIPQGNVITGIERIENVFFIFCTAPGGQSIKIYKRTF
nr:IPT/TIG domain-containing protein [Mucilaginibacter sp. L294]